MTSILKKGFVLVLVTSVFIGCENETISPNDLLVGHWNSYEEGTVQTGFTQIISTSLTIGYESGLTFLNDGTFRLRHHFNNEWSEDQQGSIGNFDFKKKVISLTYFPGTTDEYKLELKLVRLDENHLWFRHSLFGEEREYHLVRSH